MNENFINFEMHLSQLLLQCNKVNIKIDYNITSRQNMYDARYISR